METYCLYPRRLELSSIRGGWVVQQGHRAPLDHFYHVAKVSPHDYKMAAIPSHHIFTGQCPKQKARMVMGEKGWGFVEDGILLICLSFPRGKYFHGAHEGTGSYHFVSWWQEGEHTATPSCKRVWKMSAWLLKTQEWETARKKSIRDD